MVHLNDLYIYVLSARLSGEFIVFLIKRWMIDNVYDAVRKSCATALVQLSFCSSERRDAQKCIRGNAEDPMLTRTLADGANKLNAKVAIQDDDAPCCRTCTPRTISTRSHFVAASTKGVGAQSLPSCRLFKGRHFKHRVQTGHRTSFI
jgi:hypothetical protein